MPFTFGIYRDGKIIIHHRKIKNSRIANIVNCKTFKNVIFLQKYNIFKSYHSFLYKNIIFILCFYSLQEMLSQ
jgi:hypothetical protein